MKIYQNNNFYTATTTPSSLTRPFGHRCIQTIIRLYRDVFLAYDGNAASWCLIRIIV
eukprot:gnl/Chilomastix_caulleri/1308.p4 GENE.gnl/Chilomastix_caulleri/1308~~gnl/Chilomastix_caulleri/1308.p4  ORF type:complete len:57 (+),score=10.30 gnl/Chilomastix_caulleri/1308:77-247(+)